jgi:Ribonuclease G/E
MNKELFVSSTPHETKVGIVEDDQLAEIYLERENEYTLAGSIYKGRVTRVLPGMQSAFVDIGLERDAFLYVSDFMDLEQQDEDLDEAIPANRPVAEARPRRGMEAATASQGQPNESDIAAEEDAGAEETSSVVPASGEGTRDSREWRGRRRRRGRRDRPEDRGGRAERGDRGDTESRFQRPTQTTRTGRDYDYGPPPGYQPIILPGESISKYRQGAPSSAVVQAEAAPPEPPSASIVTSFPDDEPMFAAEVAETLREQQEQVPLSEVYEQISETVSSVPPEAVGADPPPAFCRYGSGSRNDRTRDRA